MEQNQPWWPESSIQTYEAAGVALLGRHGEGSRDDELCGEEGTPVRLRPEHGAGHTMPGLCPGHGHQGEGSGFLAVTFPASLGSLYKGVPCLLGAPPSN